MQEKGGEMLQDSIESFFKEPGRVLLDYMKPGCKIVFTADDRHYTLEVIESGGVKVEEGKKDGDIEIIGEADVLRDLFTSKSLEEFSDKMCSYISLGKKPKLRILMERNIENVKKFMRNYYIPLFPGF
jgi:hypothetical protein